jgi:E3 ubiquitin-protein ligase MARCH6
VQFFGGPSPSVNETVATESFFDSLPTYLGPTEPYFALLGKEVRLGVLRFKDVWYRMAVGYGPAERVFAIGLGYSVVGLSLAMYLNILTVGNARTATRAVRNAVRQQLLVIKVRLLLFAHPLVPYPLTMQTRSQLSSLLNLSYSLSVVASFLTSVRSGSSPKQTSSPESHSLPRHL